MSRAWCDWSSLLLVYEMNIWNICEWIEQTNNGWIWMHYQLTTSGACQPIRRVLCLFQKTLTVRIYCWEWEGNKKTFIIKRALSHSLSLFLSDCSMLCIYIVNPFRICICNIVHAFALHHAKGMCDVSVIGDGVGRSRSTTGCRRLLLASVVANLFAKHHAFNGFTIVEIQFAAIFSGSHLWWYSMYVCVVCIMNWSRECSLEHETLLSVLAIFMV